MIDRPADREAADVHAIERLRLSLTLADVVVGDPRIALRRIPSCSAKLARPRFGHVVHEPAIAAAVLRRVAARDDLRFGDRVDVRVDEGVGPVFVALRDAVDHDVVAGDRRAVDRDVVGRRPAREVATEVRVLHARNHGQQPVDVAPLHLDVLELIGRDRGLPRAGVHLNRRDFGRHFDGFRDGARLERQLPQVAKCAGVDVEVVDRYGLEAFECDFHRVPPGRQRRKPEDSRFIRGIRPYHACGGLRQGHDRTRNDAPLIDDRSGHRAVAGSLRERVRDPHQKQHHAQGTEALQQPAPSVPTPG